MPVVVVMPTEYEYEYGDGPDPELREHALTSLLADLSEGASIPTRVFTDPSIQVVVHFWSDRNGRCEDCGDPAAFLAYVFGDGAPPAKVDAVCAANYAVDGFTIERIEETT